MFKSMVEKVALPLMIINREGRIIFTNQGFEKLTKFTGGELMGGNLQDVCAPYERNRYFFANLSLIKETTEFDLDLRSKGGRSFMANISFSPFFHQGREYLLLAIRDVTQKRVKEEQIREAEERYRKLFEEHIKLEAQLNRSSRLASMGELAAGIAHEINNPLGIILGFAQDILEEITGDHPLYESIKIIEQETARCGGVVKDLLDFARLKPPQITPVDLSELVRDSIRLLAPKIKKNKIAVKKAVEKGLPQIKADPQLMEQALLNVLLNAIQAMPYGGELSLKVGRIENSSPGKRHPRVRISIRDTGQGILPEHLDHIFDPFFTTKGSRGTGLGLPVCQRILEDHGGKIEVESKEDVGTTCHIYLPIE
jgi:PAS domain S-box-containing protein